MLTKLGSHATRPTHPRPKSTPLDAIPRYAVLAPELLARIVKILEDYVAP